MKTVCILQVKAFGDFVIAATVSERVAEQDRSRVRIMIGRHLRPLCDAVAPNLPVLGLATAETGVPSLFDVRRNGMWAALRSAWNLRGAIARAPLPQDALILMDHIGLRERFVIGSHAGIGFPVGVTNIYAGYEILLRDAGFSLAAIRPPVAAACQRIGIFPGSRIAAKNLPRALVADIMAEGRHLGLDMQLFLLEGERPDLEDDNLPFNIVPRQFTALCSAIADVDLVISADSLPAHLAERAGKPVFVFTPKPNPFWMPPSVIQSDQWSLFDDPAALRRLAMCWSSEQF